MTIFKAKTSEKKMLTRHGDQKNKKDYVANQLTNSDNSKFK